MTDAMWARIDDTGRVAELIRHDPAGAYHPSITWVAVPPALQPWVATQGWRVSEDGVSVEPDSLDALIAQLAQALAAERYRRQVAGVLHDGRRWHSDSAGRSSITDSLGLASEYEAATGQPWASQWKTMDGYITVDRPAVVAAGLAVGVHVSACFGREAAILDALQAAATTPDATAADIIAAYDAEIGAGWPNTEGA